MDGNEEKVWKAVKSQASVTEDLGSTLR